MSPQFPRVPGAQPFGLLNETITDAPGEPTTDFSRTDLLFGSGNEMHPLIMLSEAARDVLQRERPTGIRFGTVSV
jgi:hypothetical protein